MQYDAAYVVSIGTSECLVSSYCSACLVRPRGRIACIAFANHYRAQLAPERKEVVAQVTRGGYTVLVTMGSLARHARPTGAGLDVMRGLARATNLVARGTPTTRPQNLAPTTGTRRATRGDSSTADLPAAGCPRRRLRRARSPPRVRRVQSRYPCIGVGLKKHN